MTECARLNRHLYAVQSDPDAAPLQVLPGTRPDRHALRAWLTHQMEDLAAHAHEVLQKEHLCQLASHSAAAAAAVAGALGALRGQLQLDQLLGESPPAPADVGKVGAPSCIGQGKLQALRGRLRRLEVLLEMGHAA